MPSLSISARLISEKTGHPFFHGAVISLCVKSAVKGVQQFVKELNVTHEVQDITLLMSYVALKASEIVLDGH